MPKKILLSIASIFLIWQSYKLLTVIHHLEMDSWLLVIFLAWLINMFITGIFAFSGFAFPTHLLSPKFYYKIYQPKTLTKIYNPLATGNLGIPAGSLEENETIEACIKREVMEECGLEIITLEVIGISSNPQTQTVEYPNGDKIQYFTVEFYSNKWKGEIKIHDTTEIKKADFRDKRYLKQLPVNEQSIIESLEHYQKTGKIRLN